jgi:hypothetical protein
MVACLCGAPQIITAMVGIVKKLQDKDGRLQVMKRTRVRSLLLEQAASPGAPPGVQGAELEIGDSSGNVSTVRQFVHLKL